MEVVVEGSATIDTVDVVEEDIRIDAFDEAEDGVTIDIVDVVANVEAAALDVEAADVERTIALELSIGHVVAVTGAYWDT